MNTRKIMFFVLLPYSYVFSQNGNVALPVRIMDIVFRFRRISFVHDKTAVSNVLEKALILSNITLNSFTINYFSNTRLRSVFPTEVQQAGSDSLIVVKDADDFLDPIFQSNFRKQIPHLFKSHSRMVFAYEKASVRTKILLKKLVHEFAIDVFVVENLVLEEKPNFYKFEPVERIGLRVESLSKDKTISLVKNSRTTVADWKDFDFKEWSPKFASGTFFRMSLYHCPPYWYVNNGSLEKGVESLILDEIMRGWPVKYYIEETDPNGEKFIWDHAIGLVQQGERDAAGCSQWLIRSDIQGVELSDPIHQVCVTFLVKKPQLLPVSTFLFQSLQVSVYSAIFTVLLFVRVLLKLMKKLPQLRKSRNILLLSWVIFCILCSTYYSAGLTSNTAHPRVTRDINTLKKMAAYQVPWVQKINIYKPRWRNLDNPTMKSLSELYIHGHKILDRTEHSAIHVKILGRKYVNEIEELPLSEWKHYKLLDDCVAEYSAGFMLQENSPYTRVFSKVSQRLVESGFVNNMFHNLYMEKRALMNVFFSKYVDGVEYKLIDLERMQGALLLVAVGWVISLVIFVSECSYSRRAQKKLCYLK